MKKILVIEDNNDVRENLAEILELSNFEVFQAENGKLGVEQAFKEQPDLIICDVMMPELDGFGVLHILSNNPTSSNIPFIFLTAKAEASDFRKGMNLGADDYLTKPFEHTELLDAIERRLKKSAKVQQSFDGTSNGLRTFIDEARGQKEFENLSKEKEKRKFPKKSFVYQEGEYAKYLFFVATGKIKTIKINEWGKEYITEIYKPGDFFGYQALIQNSPFAESAIAMEDSELSMIPKSDFTALLHTNRDFSSQFIKMMANNIHHKEEKLLSLAYNSIRKRVAEALVSLSEKYETDDTQKIKILRDDLASMVGTAKESVIRVLTDFKNEKLISIEGGAIIILKKKELEELPN